MSAQEALQLIIIPHRPAKVEEISMDLAPAFQILQKYFDPLIIKHHLRTSVLTYCLQSKRSQSHLERKKVRGPVYTGRFVLVGKPCGFACLLHQRSLWPVPQDHPTGIEWTQG